MKIIEANIKVSWGSESSKVMYDYCQKFKMSFLKKIRKPNCWILVILRGLIFYRQCKYLWMEVSQSWCIDFRQTEGSTFEIFRRNSNGILWRHPWKGSSSATSGVHLQLSRWIHKAGLRSRRLSGRTKGFWWVSTEDRAFKVKKSDHLGDALKIQYTSGFITARKLCFYTCLSFILFTGGVPDQQTLPWSRHPPGPGTPPL